MQEIGNQYPNDNKTDPTGFLSLARLHQSKFRSENLNVPFDTYGNYLTKKDGCDGRNFYDGFGIFDAVKKYRKYNKPLYSNMLRSEHIPFNLFIPLNENRIFCKNVFNKLMGNTIQTVDKIIIEYAPKPKENYLNDGTSFDTYIEYTHINNSKGIIGIEVKYTEKGYKLISNSKEEQDINDSNSKYISVTDKCNIYISGSIPILKTDKFRQVWRNQLLGESILLTDYQKFKYFTSLTLFPRGNTHFIHTSKEYIEMLIENKNKFLALTYEGFFEVCDQYCPNEKYKDWLNYLTNRYIISTEL